MISLSQKQIILGGLLGDSSMSLQKRQINCSQSINQEEYLKWKNSFFNTKVKYTVNVWHGNKYPRCYFYYYIKNEDNDLFSFICKNLYSKGRKKISVKYLEELSPLGLAVWWLDDGSICVNNTNRYGKLATNCFNYEEHILIQQYFKKRWNIVVQIKQEKEKYYFIRFNSTELKKLISIIYQYVCEIPSMIYKIDLKYVYEKCIGEDFVTIYNFIESHKAV